MELHNTSDDDFPIEFQISRIVIVVLLEQELIGRCGLSVEPNSTHLRPCVSRRPLLGGGVAQQEDPQTTKV